MTRTRLAVVLAVVAGACVLVTGSLAVATYVGDDPQRDPQRSSHAQPHRVHDPRSGATFTVPAGWRVHGQQDRISYGDVAVRGPALLREGYCKARPKGSFRAVAGFTGASFQAWVDGVAGDGERSSNGTERSDVVLADGTRAQRWHVALGLAADACSSGQVDIAMVRARGVGVVVVADTGGEPGTLTGDALDEIAASLELP